jgi:superfamily I DNA/RNA helicase
MSIDDIDMSSGTWLLLARNSYLLGELSESTKAKGYNYNIRGKSSISSKDIKAIKLWEKYRQGYEPNESEKELLRDYVTSQDKSKIWHEAFDKIAVETIEYYKSLHRRGESLVKSPRINIGTIHSSKGGEADHVVLLTDMAYSTWDASSFNMDAEHRCWYVGATRCKQTLDFIQPRGRYFYQI